MGQPKKPIKKSGQTVGEYNALLRNYKVQLHKYELENNPEKLSSETTAQYQNRSKYFDKKIKDVEDKNFIKRAYNTMEASQEADTNFLRGSFRKTVTSPIHLANSIHDAIDTKKVNKYKSKVKRNKEHVDTTGNVIDVINLLTLSGLTKPNIYSKTAQSTIPLGIQAIDKIGKNILQNGAQDLAEEKIKNYIEKGTNTAENMKKSRKYRTGTGAGGVNNYVVSPNETLAEYQLMMDQAQAKGDSNIWANTVIPMASSLLSKLPGMFPGETQLPQNALGNSNASGPIEVEGGEILENPNGQMQKAVGPSHEQGGIDTEVEAGTRIFSDQLKRGGKTMAQRKEAREKRLANLEKTAAERKGDAATKNTFDRMKLQLDKEEESDLMMQEMADAVSKMKEASGQGAPKYSKGTGTTGVPPKYVKGYTAEMFKPLQDRYMEANPGIDFDAKAFQTSLGFTGKAVDGVFGENTYIAGEKKYNPATAVNNITPAGFAPMSPKPISLENPLPMFDPSNQAPVMEKTVGGFNPTMGDVMGITGNMYSAFAGINNTEQNRAGDTPNINPYVDFGKDALDANSDSMKYIEGVTANAKTNNRRNAISTKRSARNSSRGLNQQRAMDMAIDLEANNQELTIDDNNSNKMMQLLSQKSQLENQQDQAVMTGEYERDMNNRKDRDAFYTQKGKDLAGIGTGIQQTGKDLNDIAGNDMEMKLLNQMSKYFQFDAEGNITGIKEQETKASKKYRRKYKK